MSDAPRSPTDAAPIPDTTVRTPHNAEASAVTVRAATVSAEAADLGAAPSQSEPFKRVRIVAGAPVIEVVHGSVPVTSQSGVHAGVEVSELTFLPATNLPATEPLSATEPMVTGPVVTGPVATGPAATQAAPVQDAALREAVLREAVAQNAQLQAAGLQPAPQPEEAQPEASSAEDLPLSSQPAYVAPITPAQGGWAVVVLLLTQQVVVGLGEYWRIPMGISMTFAFVLSVVALLALLPYPIKLLRQDSRWRTRPRIGVMLGALLLYMVASRGFVLFLVSLWPAAMNVKQELLSHGLLDSLLIVLAAGFAIPFAEEVAFRGLLMRGLERSRGSVFAALASSIVFGMAHGGPMQIAGIIPLAWIMARAVQYTGSLWTSVGLHMLNNLLAAGVMLWLQRHTLDAAPGASMFGGVSLSRVPFTLGLAGLLLGSAALVVATAWLKPRPLMQPQPDAPRTWTVSTILLAALALLLVGYGLKLTMQTAATPNF